MASGICQALVKGLIPSGWQAITSPSDEMAVILHIAFTPAFPWIKMLEFFIEISLKFVSNCPINNVLLLVQIMAWCPPGDKPLSEPLTFSLPMHIYATRPQWSWKYFRIHKNLFAFFISFCCHGFPCNTIGDFFGPQRSRYQWSPLYLLHQIKEHMRFFHCIINTRVVDGIRFPTNLLRAIWGLQYLMDSFCIWHKWSPGGVTHNDL